jgi:glycosyltransferase involved in cell wall biosynthesis
MRILHLVQRYHPAVGGAEIHLEKISTFLAAAGHDVTVVTTDSLDFELFWDPRRRRVEELTGTHDGVRVRRFPVRHLPFSQLAYPGIRRLLWLMSKMRPVPESLMLTLANYTPWVPDLWRWAASQEEPYDIVGAMTTTFEPIVAAGFRVARRQGIPFACYPLTHLGAGPRPADDALSRFYTMRHQVGLVIASDALIAQTSAEKAYYVGQGMAPDKATVVGPGVTPDEVLGGDGSSLRRRLGINGPMVLSIGAMSVDKGTVQTVEAVRRLWQAGRELDLVLIGAELTLFQSYLRGLPAADRERIHVLGSVDDDVKHDALAAATVFSMPSRADSFGISYLEAWLYGVPVIGARTWGVMDLIDEGQDGLLVPFGDAPALAGKMAYLIDNPEEANRLGENGRRKVYAGHTWDRKCQMVAQIYDHLVQSKPLV